MKRLWNLLNLWRRPRPQVGVTPAAVVHRENKWRLLRYLPRPSGVALKTPVLMVPSLINRHYVLDLKPGKSLAEYLVHQGHDVYIIDWGTPGPEDRYLSFDEVCDRYLGRALRVATRAAGVERAHLLGYCLGGTLTAIHAAARPERVASLMTLAAPVSFAEAGLLGAWTRTEGFDLDALLQAHGNVPWPLMQASFHMLRPTMNLSKAVHLIDQAWDDEFLDGFFAIETWSNDNVSFPGECYRRYIQELYRDDLLLKGQFTLSGRPARLEDITCPTLSITFQQDNIVPLASASPLIERVAAADKEQLTLSGGHVGAVVSRKAAQNLWPKMSTWWSQRDAQGQPRKRRSVA
jgi:polyhydroxyalkanoate synthase